MLKKQNEQHKLRIVSLDAPTSWQAMSDKDPSQVDPMIRVVIIAINSMLIDLMAAMSHKGWLSVASDKNKELNEPTRLVNTVRSRPIMNGIRKFYTTDRLRNGVSVKL